MEKLKIIAADAGISMTAVLNDCETTRRLLKMLPLEGQAQTWGEEVYFDIGLQMAEDQPHSEVPSGTIAFWPPGRAFCIFFGQEPFSPVNVLGKLEGDPKQFARVRSGDRVRLEVEHGNKAKGKE